MVKSEAGYLFAMMRFERRLSVDPNSAENQLLSSVHKQRVIPVMATAHKDSVQRSS